MVPSNWALSDGDIYAYLIVCKALHVVEEATDERRERAQPSATAMVTKQREGGERGGGGAYSFVASLSH